MENPNETRSDPSAFLTSLNKASVTLVTAQGKTSAVEKSQEDWPNDQRMVEQIRRGVTGWSDRHRERLEQFRRQVPVARLEKERRTLTQYQFLMQRHPLVVQVRIGNWRRRMLGWLLRLWIVFKAVSLFIWRRRRAILLGLLLVGLAAGLYLVVYWSSDHWDEISQLFSG